MCWTGAVVCIFSASLEKTNKNLNIYAEKCLMFLLLCPGLFGEYTLFCKYQLVGAIPSNLEIDCRHNLCLAVCAVFKIFTIGLKSKSVCAFKYLLHF